MEAKKVYLYDTCRKCGSKKEKTTHSFCPACRKKASEPKKKKYLSNKDLYCEILVSKAKGRLTPRAAQMLMLLGKKLQSKMYYKDLDDKHDCLQEAMYSVFKFWYNFDEIKGENAFAYYSEVIKRGLAAGWNRVHKTKGADVEFISLTGYDGEGNQFERF